MLMIKATIYDGLVHSLILLCKFCSYAKMLTLRYFMLAVVNCSYRVVEALLALIQVFQSIADWKFSCFVKFFVDAVARWRHLKFLWTLQSDSELSRISKPPQEYVFNTEGMLMHK